MKFYLWAAICYMKSGIEFSTCGIMSVLKSVFFRALRISGFQIRGDPLVLSWRCGSVVHCSPIRGGLLSVEASVMCVATERQVRKETMFSQ